MAYTNEDRLYQSIKRLPVQIERARARLRQLENQARLYKMDHLLTDPDAVNNAYEREATRAVLQGQRKNDA